jgi:hypothetical protein
MGWWRGTGRDQGGDGTTATEDSFSFAFKMRLTPGDRSANGAGQAKPGATPQEIARNEPGLPPSLGKYPMTLGRWPGLEGGWAVGPQNKSVSS